MSSLTTFNLFPALPTELRLQIWSLSLSLPRTINVSCLKTYYTILCNTERDQFWTANSCCPALMHVNRECRHLALTIYSAYFTTSPRFYPIYLAFSQDMLQVLDGLVPFLPRSVYDSVRKLAVETGDEKYFVEYCVQVISGMAALQELWIYANRYCMLTGEHQEAYLDGLVRGLDDAIARFPTWKVPILRILDSRTGSERRVRLAGAGLAGSRLGWEKVG